MTIGVAAVGRELLHGLYTGLRGLRERPPVPRACARIDEVARRMVPATGTATLEVVRNSLHLFRQRIEPDIENFVFHDFVIATLRGAGIAALEIRGHPPEAEWVRLLRVVLNRSGPSPDTDRIAALESDLVDLGLEHLSVRTVETLDHPLGAEGRAAAVRTYEASVTTSRELFDGTAMGRNANGKQLKHAVENIVDSVLDDQASLQGLSALKDFDDYAFTHAVNVCIYCVAIGRRLGLSKTQLYDLGLAALVHDVGMSRIPREILTTDKALTPEQRRQMEAHTWLGALRAFEMREYGDIPLQSMIVAYEHHMHADGSGYPKAIRSRVPSIFSKIVAVASAFDAATNERAHSKGRPAAEMLRAMWEDERLGFDPVVVKALINLLGTYPVGTCVILDTHELAIVHSANPDPAHIGRPLVRLITDRSGRWLDPAPIIDLAEKRSEGGFERSILKVTTAERYGISVSKYLGSRPSD